jgi:hypothetical protein
MIEIIVAIGIMMTALIAIYALYRMEARLWLILLLAPWMLFSAGFGFLLYDKIKGYATEERIDDSKLLYAKVSKPKIYILVMAEHGPRLHVLPYSKQLEEQLESTGRALKEGRDMRVKPDDGEESTFGIKLYEFDHKRVFPKDNPDKY